MTQIKSILLLSMLFICAALNAQQKQIPDNQQKKSNKIIILDSEEGEYLQTDSIAVHKLLGNVKLLHGSDTLYCDSAFFYTDKNSVEAFGDVVIRQADGTEAYADYMRYTGSNRIVYMRSDNPMADVKLYDGKNNTLYSRELDYNLNTKIGRYTKRGFLETGNTTLESNYGQYNLKTKDARFRGDVDVIDPEYRALSTDLGYNTETEVARFFGPSVISNDKSVLQTSNGVYDTKNRLGQFVSRSSIINEDQYIEGDTLDYNRNSGFGYAKGKVIAIDTAMKSTLYCGYVEYNEQTGTMLAYDKPLMKKVDGTDSLFIKADTFFSAPEAPIEQQLSAQDSMQQTVRELHAAIQKGEDTTGSNEVTIESDSLQLLQIDVAGDDSIIDSLRLIPDTIDLADTFHLSTDTLNIQEDTILTAPAFSEKIEEHPAEEHSLKRDLVKKQMDMLVYNKRDSIDGIEKAYDDPDTAKQASDYKRKLDTRALHYNNTPPETDTSRPRYFTGYYNVVIYSDSLQGKCDSIWYAQTDSTIRMYKSPLLWPQKSQLKGDMIFLKTDSSKLKEVYVPKNAIMITRSGPEKAGMYDQIQGGSIRCYLRDNKMDSLIAMPDASSIYFIKDDDGAYVGSSEAKSEKIEVWFENEAIYRIYYRNDVEQKTTPMTEVTPSTLHLSRFSWEEDLRPKTLEEFLEGTTLPHEPLLQYTNSTDTDTTEIRKPESVNDN